MMAGLALAASDLPELARFIQGEKVGALFDPRDPKSIAAAIDAVTRDREALEAMKARARAAARETYNWDRESRRLLEIYRRLAAAPPAGPPFPVRRGKAEGEPI